MHIEKNLSNALENWNLLNHPFYGAWSEGTLSRESLQTYAREYGAFIARLPQGWQALNDEATAQEEREHSEMWEKFAQELDAQGTEAKIPQAVALVETAQSLFAKPVTALGALYAFEVQQPATAQSKLAGLKKFYRLSPDAEKYFEVHSHNEHEAEKLLNRMQTFSPAEQAQAVSACETMGKALWNALSDIYAKECQNRH
jgi:pyrroloquinoline-quinone synthase